MAGEELSKDGMGGVLSQPDGGGGGRGGGWILKC